jgi:putative ABC transport system permease protein
MRTLRANIVRVVNLFRRRQQDRELAEEMESHLALHIEDNLRSGMSPEEARRDALIKLGGIDKTYEECRDRQGFRWIADVQRDFHHSLRRLAKSPLLSLIVVLSLGLGIGANTAIFSMMRQILLCSLPVEKPEELALVTASSMRIGSASFTQSGDPEYLFSYPGFRQFERWRQQDVAEVAGFRYTPIRIAYKSEAFSATALMVSGGYFSLMLVHPFMGRTLIPADDQDAGNPVAMLGYNFWKNNLGGRADLLNQQVRIAEQIFTIVGVAPKGFYGTTVNSPPDVIIPISAAISKASPQWPFASTAPDSAWVYLIARLKPGATREQAASAYAGLYASILEELVAGKTIVGPDAQQAVKELRRSRLRFVDGSHGYSTIQASSKTPLYVLAAITGMILLIAMLNAANLMLARSAARRGELAICTAIGASRSRIVAQLLSEALLLAIAGGLMGIAISSFTLRFLIALLAPTRTPLDFLTVQPEWPVLLYGLGLSILTGLVFGAYPALQAAKMAPATGLSQNSGHVSETFSSARVRKILVCAQVTLSAILLVPTGLLLKSLVNLTNVDLGLRTENLITFSLLPFEAGHSSEQSRSLFDRAERGLKSIPGITGVTSARIPLLVDGAWIMTSVTIEGYSGKMLPISKYNEIAPGFFGIMGIPLISGREFTERDNLAGHKAAIVSEQFAKAFFAGQNPIGRKIGLPGPGGPEHPTLTEIVGVVKDCHYSSIRQTPPMLFYLPWRQNEQADAMAFYVRTSLPPNLMMAQVRQVMRELDTSVPPRDLRTMEDHVRLNIHTDRMILQLAGLFAALAVTLAMIGLYGVMAYSVVRRTREFGIRIAVGATPRGIRQMVLREMAMILIFGLIIGTPVTLALCNVANNQLLAIKTVGPPMPPPLMEAPESRLFGVSAHDPIVVAFASLVLGLTAFAAAYLPAWRASRIDPISALRYE